MLAGGTLTLADGVAVAAEPLVLNGRARRLAGGAVNVSGTATFGGNITGGTQGAGLIGIGSPAAR